MLNLGGVATSPRLRLGVAYRVLDAAHGESRVTPRSPPILCRHSSQESSSSRGTCMRCDVHSRGALEKRRPVLSRQRSGWISRHPVDWSAVILGLPLVRKMLPSCCLCTRRARAGIEPAEGLRRDRKRQHFQRNRCASAWRMRAPRQPI